MGKRKYTTEEHEEYRRTEDERIAREEQDRREKADKGAARAAWLRDGGTVADFERQWSSMRDEARAERIKNADRRAREDMRQRTRL